MFENEKNYDLIPNIKKHILFKLDLIIEQGNANRFVPVSEVKVALFRYLTELLYNLQLKRH